MKTIGFIGVGIMGKSMVRNLMKAGYELHIYARTKAKVEDVIQEGAIFHDSIGACVADRDAVITIVGYPGDVEEVYFEPGTIFDSAKQGAYLIDMTTSSPSLAERIYAEGTKRGFRVMDAPVTGGDVVKKGRLQAICPQFFSSQAIGYLLGGSTGLSHFGGKQLADLPVLLLHLA